MAIDKSLGEVVTAHRAANTLIDTLRKGGAKETILDSLSALLEKSQPSLRSVANSLSSLVTAVQSADGSPTQGQKAVYSEYRRQLDVLLRRWSELKKMASKGR
jgi:hypothetical protein